MERQCRRLRSLGVSLQAKLRECLSPLQLVEKVDKLGHLVLRDVKFFLSLILILIFPIFFWKGWQPCSFSFLLRFGLEIARRVKLKVFIFQEFLTVHRDNLLRSSCPC